MRLFVAGWQGQLARSIVEAATARDDVQACAMGRPALDLCEQPTILRALEKERPDVVINTAAFTAVDEAESRPNDAHMLNCEGARRLARAAANLGVPIIHLSTDYVFDGSKLEPYVEDDPTSPANIYGETKLFGERGVAEANPMHIVARTSWVHSPFGKNFVKSMMALAKTRSELSVVDDQVGSPTYAPHLAAAILDIAAKAKPGNRGWGVYHVAGGGETSWHGLAGAVFSQMAERGRDVPEVHAIPSADYPTPAARPANSRLNCEKVREVFGVSLPAWEEGVRLCVDRLLEADN